MIVLALALMLAGANDNSARAQFTACLKIASEKGGDQKIAPDGFVAFAKLTCAAEIAGFRSSVISYDVKAGWTRKKAEPDADSQVGDYLDEWGGHFRDKAKTTVSK